MSRKNSKSRTGTPDDDAPEMTAADFAAAKPAREILPGLLAASKKRGRPRVAAPKVVVSVRMGMDAARIWRTLPPSARAKLVQSMESRAAALASKSARGRKAARR